MRISYSYFRSNTEGVERYGSIAPLYVYNATLLTRKGTFSLRMGILDQDELFASYTSNRDAPIKPHNPFHGKPIYQDLDLSPFFPDINENGLSGELPREAREYLLKTTGITDDELNIFWTEVTGYAFVDKAHEHVRTSTQTWDKQSYETGSNHRAIFGATERQRKYNHTRFLSKYIYDLNLTKYEENPDGKPNHLLRQLLTMNKSSDRATELVCFASLLATNDVRRIDIINPSRKSMCIRLDGRVGKDKVSYSVFKGTVPTELPAYLAAYAKLIFAPEKELASVIAALDHETDTKHIACGHSYGAWLAHEVATRTTKATAETFLYNPPSSVEAKLAKETAVRYENGYKVVATPVSFMQTHPRDPISYPSLRSLLSVSAHSIATARHQDMVLALGKLNKVDQNYVQDGEGLNSYPAWAALLKELSVNSGTAKESAVLGVINEHLGDVDSLFGNVAFSRYIETNLHNTYVLREEATAIAQVFNRVKVNVFEHPVAPLNPLGRISSALHSLKESDFLSRVKNWIDSGPDDAIRPPPLDPGSIGL